MAAAEDEDIKQRFLKAAEFVRGIVDKLDSKRLLYLYARFKQVTFIYNIVLAFWGFLTNNCF